MRASPTTKRDLNGKNPAGVDPERAQPAGRGPRARVRRQRGQGCRASCRVTPAETEGTPACGAPRPSAATMPPHMATQWTPPARPIQSGRDERGHGEPRIVSAAARRVDRRGLGNTSFFFGCCRCWLSYVLLRSWGRCASWVTTTTPSTRPQGGRSPVSASTDSWSSGRPRVPCFGAQPWKDHGGEVSVLVPDVDAAIDLLSREVLPGDVVLVKASRAVGLERVAAALLEPTGGDQA